MTIQQELERQIKDLERQVAQLGNIQRDIYVAMDWIHDDPIYKELLIGKNVAIHGPPLIKKELDKLRKYVLKHALDTTKD